jgi:hypothetical protein
VARTLTLHLAQFEREALDAYEASERVPAERAVQTAVLYYLRDGHSTRPTWRVPALPGGGPRSAVELDVELGEETARALITEASAQGVEPEVLARHALLFFLADFDSGEVARALERALRDD